MHWEVEYTNEFADWWETLDRRDRASVFSAVESLELDGPSLGRPLVDNVHQSRHSNMKELPPAGNIRIFFAFDPTRAAILLLGGDKTGEWNLFYRRMIPVANELYDIHLETLKHEGQIP